MRARTILTDMKNRRIAPLPGYRGNSDSPRGLPLSARAARMQLARALLDKTLGTLRFVTCACGNEQPVELGRPRPACESCGDALPKGGKAKTLEEV
jgi:ribosomal protein S27E